MADRVGQIFGNYQLLRLIGQGNFAEVYLGKHRYLDTIAAIKVLQRMGEVANESFRREARTIAHLQHTHIIRIYEFGIEEQTPYLVMEYTPEGSLRTIHPRGSRLFAHQIVNYVKQIAGALDYAHSERVIHRDIKPENILLNSRQEVLLSDFGIAVVLDTLDTRSTQNQAGTPLYMAPEQIHRHPVPASDQYALAIMVYEWLCGEVPFRGSLFEIFTQHLYQDPPGLHARVPGLRPGVEQVIFKALAKDPQRRYLSVQDFASALDHAFNATQPLPGTQTLTSATYPDLQYPSVSQNSGVYDRIDILPTWRPSLPITPGATAQFLGSIPVSVEGSGANSPGSTPMSQAALAPLRPTMKGQHEDPHLQSPPRAPRHLLLNRWMLLSLAVLVIVASGLSYFFLFLSGSPPTSQKVYDTLVQQPSNLTFHSGGWEVARPPARPPYRCSYDSTSGVYSAAIIPGQAPDFPDYYSTYCWNKTARYQDFLYQVDVSIDRGSCAGLLFRLTESTLKELGQPGGYYMGICPDWNRQDGGGTCQFFIYSSGSIDSQSNQPCKDITNNRDGRDTIAVLAQKDTLSFFINKKFIFAREDAKYQAGYFAVVVANTKRPSGKSDSLIERAQFTNGNVWQIA